MVTHRTRWLVALAFSGAVACSFGVDLDGLVGGPPSTPTNDGSVDSGPLTDVATSEPEAAAPSTAEIVSIGAGANFNCALKKDGTVNCWGRGTEGRLGTGTQASSSSPSVVVNIDDATELSVGTNHACVVLQNGTVECWGQNDSKQLGNSTATNASSPTPVVGLTQGVKHITAGGIFTCAHLADDTAACWGDNQQGELGDGTQTARPGPVAVKGVTGIKQLVAISSSACALVADGSVWCWGLNTNGEIGTGTLGGAIPTPTQIASLSGVTALGVGNAAQHVCAVLGDGTVKCWGYGQAGNLGNAGTTDSATPVPAATVTNAVSVMLGQSFTCALHEDASVNCWGANSSATLPLGDGPNPPASASTPLPATGLPGVLALAGGATHACALKDARDVLCWGSDQYGALGRRRVLIAPTKVDVANTTDIAQFGVGREFACASRTSGALTCWGSNSLRQQAHTDVAINGMPSPVPNVANVAQVATGDTETCIVGADAGTVQCWGEGDQGSLGNFQNPYIQSTPVTFQSGASIDVGTGASFACALTKSNEVECAGYNSDGRLGRPTSTTATPGPVVFPAANDAGPTPLFANAIAIGRTGACAIYSSHTKLACWGSNSDGQLGTGGNSRNYPADVTLPHAPVVARMGYRHACAIVGTTNDVYCWGRNANGQLTGTDTGSFVAPRLVDLGGVGAKDIALGDDHTCAVLTDGTVMCWGAGTQGQLGNGALVDSSVPVVAAGVTAATAIRASENHTCALTATGLVCWGTDYAGQLGVSALMQTGAPAAVEGL